MENASKALIMAGGILIGVIIISMGVYIFLHSGELSSQYDMQRQQQEVDKFNSQFSVYQGQEEITIHDIITIVNLAKENNKKNPTQQIKVLITNSSIDLTNYDYNKINQIISGYIEKSFVCQKMSYNIENGKIMEIQFEQKN